MEEERRLAYVGITRAEEELYCTNARMRTLFGRTNINPPSRFIEEIPDEVLEHLNGGYKSYRREKSTGSTASVPVRRPVIKTTGSEDLDWRPGDKAMHKKWGIGTVVSVRGEGENKELDIAFPSPTGIKRLLAKFAPIEKMD